MRDYTLLAKAFRHCEENGLCSDCPMYDNCPDLDGKKNAADAIEELLAELTTIRKQMPHWISVEERLPEFHMNDSGCVCTKNIVFRTEYKTVHLGYVIRTANNIETVEGFEQILMDRWYDQTGDMIEGVTHWMPLPAPPKGVE